MSSSEIQSLSRIISKDQVLHVIAKCESNHTRMVDQDIILYIYSNRNFDTAQHQALGDSPSVLQR